MDTITTRTVGTGFAEIGESVLTETTQTAIVFKPQMHEGGIRGIRRAETVIEKLRFL